MSAIESNPPPSPRPISVQPQYPDSGWGTIFALPLTYLWSGLSTLGWGAKALSARLYRNLYPLQICVDEMKDSEEKCRWESLKSVAAKLSVASIEDHVQKFSQKEIILGKIGRYLANLSKGQQDPRSFIDQMAAMEFEIPVSSKTIEKLAPSLTPEQVFEIYSQIKLGGVSIDEKRSGAAELHDKMAQLLSFFNSTPANLTEANREVTKIVREILSTDAYLLLKEDPEDLTIKAIHRICIAIWNDVHALSAYEKLGRDILEADAKPEDCERPLTPNTVINNLEKSHATASRQLYQDVGIHKPFYLALHPTHALQMMASQRGFLNTFASWMGHYDYDQHMVLSNNPSLQGRTIASIDGAEAVINNCYGGSPTYGNEISLEYLAVLQGMENNHFAKEPDPEIPCFVSYTNLQDLRSQDEYPRSCTLMELNERFPMVFSGITLSKDSPFYKNEKNTPWNGHVEFSKEMKQKFMHPNSFTMDKRVELEGDPDGGFYFPGAPEEWEGLFDQIFAIGNKRFDQVVAKAKDAIPPKTIRGAYIEYVYSMIQGYQEIYSCKRIKGAGLKRILIMAIRACKECIDRGGAENTKYFYYNMKAALSRGMSLIAGIFHSRALSARNRMINLHRMEYVFDLMKLVGREEFQEDLSSLLEPLNAKVLSYEPAIQ